MKQVRQYIGILAAAAAYYFVHEGAHLLCAVLLGAFKQIRFMGIGMQIDVYPERMTDGQMALFCAAGAEATLFAGIMLAALAGKISRIKSKLLRAVMYYITIALLLLDPLYLSILCGFFGGRRYERNQPSLPRMDCQKYFCRVAPYKRVDLLETCSAGISGILFERA